MLWTQHLLNHGDVCAILVLDYFSAKDFDMSRLSIYFTIKFLLPNVTNMHWPVDKGMIASLKAWYNHCIFKDYWQYLKNLVDFRGLQFIRQSQEGD